MNEIFSLFNSQGSSRLLSIFTINIITCITTFPWKHGKYLVWDATVVDAFTKSHIIANPIESDSAAKTAEKLKSRKYHDLAGNNYFQPIAYETTGCCGPFTASFVDKLGRRLFELTGDPLKAVWLGQKVFLAIPRGNAASILSCLCSSFLS